MQNLPTILFNGEDRVLQFKLFDASGAALDITGWAITLYVGDSTSAALLTKALTVTGGPAGECETAPITPAELTSLTSGVKRYALRRTGSGVARVIQTGSVPVEVTFL